MSESPQLNKDEGERPKAEVSDASGSAGSPQAGFAAFWAELKRRKVMRVAGVYAVVAWLIIQVASSTFGWFDIPKWAFQFVVIMLVTFFPVAIVLAWAFEMTPDGIKTTKHAREERGGAPASPAEQSKRNMRTVVFAAALPTLIFGALAVFFFFRSSSQDSSPLDPSPASSGIAEFEKSIAVLPLQNLSPDPENAFFAGGVHEDILTNLSRIAELKVISRTSTLQYADAKRNLSEIGAELGVRYVVEGSVRRAGDQVRVTVQLIDAKTDEHLWAENYDRELRDVFAIQSDVAKEIAGQLHATISPQAVSLIERVPTENLEAYDYLVRGREKLFFVEDVQQSLSYFKKALELDPKLAAAHVQMAYYYLALSVQNFIDPADGMPKAIEWLESAVTLEGDLSEINEVRGALNLMYHWKREAARKDFELALKKNPGSSSAFFMLSFYYMSTGETDKAIEWIRRAIELDPLNLRNRLQLIEWYRLTSRYESAVEEAKVALEIDPNYSEAYRMLGMIYAHIGKYDEAIANAEKALRLQGGIGWSAINLTTIYAAAGKYEYAKEILAGLKEDRYGIYVPGYAYAMIHANMGEMDAAFEALESSFEAKDYWATMLEHEPFYQPMKSDPRYKVYLDRLNSLN